MPQGVVNQLEVVQIDEHHHHHLPGALGMFQRRIRLIIERYPVGQPRHQIIVGKLVNAFF